jgi:hypothetical protein
VKLFKRKPPEYTTVGAEITQNRTRTWLALAGADDNGRVTVELLSPLPGTDAVPTIVMLYETHPVECVAIDPTSATATLIDGLRNECVPLLLVDAQGMAVALGRFLDLTVAGKLRHRGDPALTDAVREAAARRTSSGAQRVDRVGPAADPAALVASELAVLALGDVDTGGGLGPEQVTVAYSGDPSRLPPHLERQQKAREMGFPPQLPAGGNWPGLRRKSWD